MLSFILGKHLGIELLDQMVNGCLHFKDTAELVFQRDCIFNVITDKSGKVS